MGFGYPVGWMYDPQMSTNNQIIFLNHNPTISFNHNFFDSKYPALIPPIPCHSGLWNDVDTTGQWPSLKRNVLMWNPSGVWCIVFMWNPSGFIGLVFRHLQSTPKKMLGPFEAPFPEMRLLRYVSSNSAVHEIPAPRHGHQPPSRIEPGGDVVLLEKGLGPSDSEEVPRSTIY